MSYAAPPGAAKRTATEGEAAAEGEAAEPFGALGAPPLAAMGSEAGRFILIPAPALKGSGNGGWGLAGMRQLTAFRPLHRIICGHT
eukprot:9496271-Pyramimonas_sp.AAC.1